MNDTVCENCAKHVGSVYWRGEMDHLTATRMGHESLPKWCLCCTTKASIEYAEKQAARLPGLREELEHLLYACPEFEEPERPIDTGDAVEEISTGLVLEVAAVRGDALYWVGWPPGKGDLSNYRLKERATDAYRQHLLGQIAASSHSCAAWARARLRSVS